MPPFSFVHRAGLGHAWARCAAASSGAPKCAAATAVWRSPVRRRGFASLSALQQKLRLVEQRKRAAYEANQFDTLPGIQDEIDALNAQVTAHEEEAAAKEEANAAARERASQQRAQMAELRQSVEGRSAAAAASGVPTQELGVDSLSAEQLDKLDSVAGATNSTVAPEVYASVAASTGRSAFWTVEQLAWGDDSVAGLYEDGFGALTRQSISPLLDRAGVGRDTRLLDVATGPGFGVLAAMDRGALCCGLDFSAEMIQLATAAVDAHKQWHVDKAAAAEESEAGGSPRPPHPPGTVVLLEGDAMELPFGADAVAAEGGLFDAVICNFGVLHLEHPERFFSEAFRVLKPGGTLAFTAWAAPPATEGFAITLDAISDKGDPSVDLPPGPPFFAYANPDLVREQLSAAGFGAESVESQEVPMVWRLPHAGALWERMSGATARTRATIQAQTLSQKQAIEGQMLERCAEMQTQQPDAGVAGSEGTEIVLKMPCVLSSAKKPHSLAEA